MLQPKAAVNVPLPSVLQFNREQMRARSSTGGLADQIPFSIFRGKMSLGGMDVECHVLSDERRVFARREVVRAIIGGAR
jgi:hypothetical protein